MGLKTRKSGSMINLKIKEQSYPEFQLMGKEDGEWIVKQVETSYEGIFSNARIEEYEYQKKMRKKLVLEFTDKDSGENEIISVNFNSLALSIINTLSNVENLVGSTVVFSLYAKRDDSGEYRPKIHIEVNGEKTGWKFGPEIVGKIYEHHEKWVDMFDKNIKPKLLDRPFIESGNEIVDEILPELDSSPSSFDDDLPF